MITDVITRSFDFARTGANTAETTLTPAAVKTRGVRILQTLTIPDDPRLEAQPLYLSGIEINGKARNVIYQASMGNTVYAWDADTGALLWKTNLGTPINGSNDIDAHDINVKWGILSTPVIDRPAGLIYVCAWISPDHSGRWQNGEHFVAALDIVSGAPRLDKPMLSLEGAQFDPGPGGSKQEFRSKERKQRAALAMVDGAVIVCFGTIAETDPSARGWVIAVDTARCHLRAAQRCRRRRPPDACYFTLVALPLPGAAFCFASPSRSARLSLSTVATLGECLPCSRRLSVSTRTPARRANSACVQPNARRARINLRARTTLAASTAG